MNSKIDNILTECIQEGWYDSHVIDCNASEIEKALLEFGKQCFEAGRDKEYDKVDGDYYDKFRDFDDYLKSL